MTTPENPERLWAAKYCDEDGFEYVTVFERPEDAEGSHCHGTDAKVQVYVREDVASDEARLFRDQRNVLASRLATAEDDARLFRDQRNVLASRLATAEDETTALRRERDALAARLFAEERRVAALREGLRVIVMRSLASVDDPSVEVMAYEIANHALMLDSDMMADGDEAAAGKGVG